MPRHLERVSRYDLHLPSLCAYGHRHAVHAGIKESNAVCFVGRYLTEGKCERVTFEMEFHRFGDDDCAIFLNVETHIEALGIIGFRR